MFSPGASLEMSGYSGKSSFSKRCLMLIGGKISRFIMVSEDLSFSIFTLVLMQPSMQLYSRPSSKVSRNAVSKFGSVMGG